MGGGHFPKSVYYHQGFLSHLLSATRGAPGPREMAGLRLRQEADLEMKIEVDK